MPHLKARGQKLLGSRTASTRWIHPSGLLLLLAFIVSCASNETVSYRQPHPGVIEQSSANSKSVVLLGFGGLKSARPSLLSSDADNEIFRNVVINVIDIATGETRHIDASTGPTDRAALIGWINLLLPPGTHIVRVSGPNGPERAFALHVRTVPAIIYAGSFRIACTPVCDTPTVVDETMTARELASHFTGIKSPMVVQIPSKISRVSKYDVHSKRGLIYNTPNAVIETAAPEIGFQPVSKPPRPPGPSGCGADLGGGASGDMGALLIPFELAYLLVCSIKELIAPSEALDYRRMQATAIIEQSHGRHYIAESLRETLTSQPQHAVNELLPPLSASLNKARELGIDAILEVGTVHLGWYATDAQTHCISMLRANGVLWDAESGQSLQTWSIQFELAPGTQARMSPPTQVLGGCVKGTDLLGDDHDELIRTKMTAVGAFIGSALKTELMW